MQRLSEPGQDVQRVALFGGAYNNWLAVNALVDDARRRRVDAIWFLGDAGGFGPCPDRTVDALRTLPIHCIQGNYDDSVGRGLEDCGCGYTDPRDNHYAQISYDYTLAHTSAENRAWLASLATEARIRVGGVDVVLSHGSPRKTNEFLWESTTPDGFIDRLCRDAGARVVACTHTGLHWQRRTAAGNTLINVGAVGRPANDGRKEVWYCVAEAVDGEINAEFVPLAYDWERLAITMAEEGLPGAFIETISSGWWTTCLEVLPARERARGRH